MYIFNLIYFQNKVKVSFQINLVEDNKVLKLEQLNFIQDLEENSTEIFKKNKTLLNIKVKSSSGLIFSESFIA